MHLLIAGGERDPNIAHLAAAAAKAGVRVTPILFGTESHPSIHWDIQRNVFRNRNKVLNADAAFIRYDVFNQFADPREQTGFRAQAWYAAMAGWLEARTDIRMLNRHGVPNVLKPSILRLAIELGMAVPRTLVTSDADKLRAIVKQKPDDWIAKPVAGGEYTRIFADIAEDIEEKAGATSAPAILQERLVSPDVRVFRVGREFHGFAITSNNIDYRADNGCSIEPLAKLPADLTRKLKRLTDRLGLDFAAADYKTCATTGVLKFLEVNTSPMFVAFDIAGGGCLTGGMVKYWDR